MFIKGKDSLTKLILITHYLQNIIFQYVIHIKIIGAVFTFCCGATSLKSCVYLAHIAHLIWD